MARPTSRIAASVLIVTFWTSLGASTLYGQPDESEAPGRRVLAEANCQRCHEVSSAGIEMQEGAKVKGPDLSKLSSPFRETDRLTAYLQRTTAKEGKKHPFPWRGEDTDLRELVDWLLEQQAADAPSPPSSSNGRDRTP